MPHLNSPVHVITYSVLDDVKLNVTGLGLANIDLVLNT